MTPTLNTNDVVRELDFRANDGIEVQLLWQPGSEDVIVDVFDTNVGKGFRLDVPGSRALDAFQHPYAYAAFDGVEHGKPERHSVHA
jgi:hypothetical protein